MNSSKCPLTGFSNSLIACGLITAHVQSLSVAVLLSFAPDFEKKKSRSNAASSRVFEQYTAHLTGSAKEGSKAKDYSRII